MSASLIFDGTLELCDPNGHVSEADYWFEALAEGTSFGDPQPVEVAIASLMRDGALVETTGDQNRETTFVVRVRGSDSDSLDAGVQALHAATRKRTTLTWTPPDGYGDVRVWDVETSNLLEPNGFEDLPYLRNEMTFKLRLVCQPFRRSDTLIIDDAGTPPSGGGTLLYNCESTTGWSAFDGTTGTYAVDSVLFCEGAGSLKSQAAASKVGVYTGLGADTYVAIVSDQFATSIDTDAGGYLTVAVRTEWTDAAPVFAVRSALESAWMEVGGTWAEVDSFAATAYEDNGFVHYAWPVDADLTVTGLRFRVEQVRFTGYTTLPFVWYDDIELLPAATTDHQIVKTLTVAGSARTTGSLRIAAPSESVALGQVLAITTPTSEIPAGFQPDGRRWVTQGATTVDATSLHGSYYTPDTSTYSASASVPAKPIFKVPVGMLTAGPYTMVALVKAEASSLNFGVQAQLDVDGTQVGPTSEAEVSPTGLTTGWQFVTVGTVYLPPLPVQNADSTTTVRLLFKGAKFADVYMIPGWQVGGSPVADFSIVDCGTGTVEPGGASSSLWIDSPSTTQPQGGWWRGPTDDRANSQSAWPDAKWPGVHTFRPGGLTAFVVSTEAQGPTVRLEYFPRYL